MQVREGGDFSFCHSENFLSFFFFSNFFFQEKKLQKIKKKTDLLPSRPRRPLRAAPRQHPRAGSQAGRPQLRGGGGCCGGQGLQLFFDAPGLSLAGRLEKRDQGGRRRRGRPAGLHLLLAVHADQPAAGVAAALVRLCVRVPLDLLDPFPAAAVQQGVSEERKEMFFFFFWTFK